LFYDLGERTLRMLLRLVPRIIPKLTFIGIGYHSTILRLKDVNKDPSKIRDLVE